MAFWSDETFCVIVNEAKDITFGFATDPVYVFEKTIAKNRYIIYDRYREG